MFKIAPPQPSYTNRAPAAPNTSWHGSTERHLACINMDVDFERQGNKCWRIDGMGRVALEDGLGRLERTSVKHVCDKCWQQFTQSCNYARHRKKCRLSAVHKVRWIKSTCPFAECQQRYVKIYRGCLQLHPLKQNIIINSISLLQPQRFYNPIAKTCIQQQLQLSHFLHLLKGGGFNATIS